MTKNSCWPKVQTKKQTKQLQYCKIFENFWDWMGNNKLVYLRFVCCSLIELPLGKTNNRINKIEQDHKVVVGEYIYSLCLISLKTNKLSFGRWVLGIYTYLDSLSGKFYCLYLIDCLHIASLLAIMFVNRAAIRWTNNFS